MAAQCRSCFVGPLSYYADSLAFDDVPGAVPIDDLADPLVFASLIDRFARHHPGGDRAAVVSFWSQHIFSRLVIPATILCLTASRPLPLAFTGLRVRFCPDRGTALTFQVGCDAPERAPDALVRALYDEGLAPLVAISKRHGGLSARLFWENAASYGLWILGEIARSQPALRPDAEALLRDVSWPQAGCAAMRHLRTAALEGTPLARRVCCLRYRLPGVGRCAGTCPLPPDTDGTVPDPTVSG